MTDGIIKGAGNSRYLKTVQEALSLYPTYEAFLQALIAGTLPVDLNGINASGWSQMPTPLNKANLLSDATTTALGLDPEADPSVDGALLALHNRDNAVSAEISMIKLFDVTTTTSVNQVDFDLSGIDLNDYCGLELCYNALLDTTNSSQLNLLLNGVSTAGAYFTANVSDTPALKSSSALVSAQIGTASYVAAAGSGGNKIICSFGPQPDGEHIQFSAVATAFYGVTGGSQHNFNMYAGTIAPSAWAGGLESIHTLNVCANSGAIVPGSRFTLYGIRR